MTDNSNSKDSAVVVATLEAAVRQAILDLDGDPSIANMEMSTMVIGCEFKFLDRDIEHYLTFAPLGTSAAAAGISSYMEGFFDQVVRSSTP